MLNPITMTDCYKLDHRRQYPANTKVVYSNWTPRSSRIPGQNKVVFFGLQYFLQKYLQDEFRRNFFERGRGEVERRYKNRVDGILGPNDIGTEHIGELHELGYLPLIFNALPEGTLVPLRVPMFTFENTDSRFFWLTNYIETMLSATLWMPCTSATLAYRMRSLLNEACEATGGAKSFVQWQGHDFSFRGMASIEAAAASGAGHLLSFTGTDTISAIDFIEEFYPEDCNGMEFLGGSVPATEHAVMSAGGHESELETFNRLLDLYPKGIVSVVSDTWDLFNVITNILPQLKNKIMSRDGKLVIRPDSGNPADIICGDPKYSTEPRGKGVVELLWDLFGGTINEKGFKQLDSHIGVIYGDAITYDRCQEICQRLAAKGFASTNMVYGVGSFTYQYNTRDTFGFAVKATWAQIGDEERNLFKKPATDDGTKNSATGRLAVIRNEQGELIVIEKASQQEQIQSLLRPVWCGGLFFQHSYQPFSKVRKTLWPQK